MHRVLLCCIFCVVLAIAGCDAAPNLAATDSGIEFVPIPVSAEVHPNLDDTWTVEGVTFEDLIAWYQDQMPVGEDYGPWEWCDGSGEGTEIYYQIYSRGAEDILSVSVADDDPPAVLIGADRSGPC